MSPTFRRTPERFCGSAPASASRPISSSRPVSPSPTAPSAAPEWTTSTPSRSRGTDRGKVSRPGAAARATACCCSPPLLPSPIWISATGRTISCCSDANRRACRKRSTPRPMPALRSRCAPACVLSTSRSPRPWPLAKRCGRPAGWLFQHTVNGAYAATTPGRPPSTANVRSVAMSALGSAASETTRMRTCMCARSRSTQT